MEPIQESGWTQWGRIKDHIGPWSMHKDSRIEPGGTQSSQRVIWTQNPANGKISL